MRYSQRKPVQKPFWRRPVGLVAIGVVSLALIITVLELTNVTHLFHEQKATSSTIPATSNNNSANPSPSSDSNGATPSPAPTPTPPPETPKSSGTVATLLEPSGTFVSNHQPNLDGDPRPAQEQSTCTTTPGASCSIIFTQGDITKTLEAKTADANGNVIWNWDIKSAGFSTGAWKIKAVATLNGQSKSASDAQDLVVQP